MENYLFFAILIATIWGIVPFFTRYVLRKIHYKSLILIESILAFSISMVFCCCHRNDIINDFGNIDVLCVFAIVLIGLSVFSANILYYSIIKDHETYLISAITSMSPLIVLFISYFFLKENMNFSKIVGVFLIVSGVFFITH
jgi:uncharacterized membrane protein